MGRHARSIAVVESPERLLAPEITHPQFAGEIQVGPIDANVLRKRAGVEKPDGMRTVLERFHIDKTAALPLHAHRRLPEGILVDLQHLVVGEQGRG